MKVIKKKDRVKDIEKKHFVTKTSCERDREETSCEKKKPTMLE